MNLLAKLLLVTSLGMACGVQATVIDSIAGGGTTHAFSEFNTRTEGPIVESGFTWTSTSDQSFYGSTGNVANTNLGENGEWGGNYYTDPFTDYLTHIALNVLGSDDYMTITFDNPVSSVLAFVNHMAGVDVGTPYMAIYGEDGTLLESLNLAITSPNGLSGINEGDDWGFSQSSATIKSLRLGGAGIVAANLRTETVPEPASLALLGIGLAGLGVLRRRQRA